jgi:hypothetical protein
MRELKVILSGSRLTNFFKPGYSFKISVGTYTAFTPNIAFTSIPVQPDCRP